MKKAIGVGLFLVGFVVALNFFLPVVAHAQKQPGEASTSTQDLLMEKVENAKALYKDGKLDESEQAFLAVRSEAAASGAELDKGVERTIDKYLGDIQQKRADMKRDVLVGRYKAAEGLYKEGRYDEALKAFTEIRNDAEAQGVDLGFWTTRGLNSYITKSGKKIEEAAAVATVAEEAQETAGMAEAEAEKKEAAAGLKDELAEKFKQGESLYKAGNYVEAKPVLQEVSDTAALNNISLGYFADRRLRSYLENVDDQIIEAAKARQVAEMEQKQEQVKQQLLARYNDGEALYKEGKYAEAGKVFQEIQQAQQAEGVKLGYLKDRGVASYIAKSEKAIADAQAQAEAQVLKQAEAQAAEQAAQEAEAKRLAGMEAEKKAAAEVEAARLAKVEAKKQAEAEAEAQRLAKIEAEKQAAAEAEAQRLAKLEAEKQAAAEAEAARLAKMEAEKKAAAEAQAVAKAEKEAAAMAKSEAEAAAKAEKEAAVAAAAEAKAVKEAEEKAAAEVARQAAGEKEALKAKLNAQFKEAEKLYKAKQYAEAKPMILDVKNVSEAGDISLGFWTTRALNGYLSDIDKKIAEADGIAQRDQMRAAAAGQGDVKIEEIVDTEAAKKARAEAAYKEGMAAYKGGDYQSSLKNAFRALSLVPEYDEATMLLELSQKKLAEGTSSEDPFEVQWKARRDAAETEIMNYLADANKSMVEKEYVIAEGLAAKARATALANIQYSFENYVQEADDLLKRLEPLVAAENDRQDKENLKKSAQQLKIEKEQSAARVEQNVKTLMANANDKIKLEDYKGAAEDLDAVIKLKPDYAFASVLRELVDEWAAQKRAKDADTGRLASLRALDTDIAEQMVFSISPVLQYPPHWKEKMAGRELYMGTSSSQELEASVYRDRKMRDPQGNLASQEVEKKLQKPIPYFDFTGQPFMAMIELLRSTGAFNVVVDPAVAPGPELTITLQLTDSTIKTVLDLITAQADLKWTIRENYVYISDDAGMAKLITTGTQMVIVYDIRDLIAPLEDWGGGGTGRSGSSGNSGGSRGGGGSSGRGGGGSSGSGSGSGSSGSGGRFFGGAGEFGGERGGGGGLGGGGGAGGAGAARGGASGRGTSLQSTDTQGYDLADLIMQTVDRTIWNVAPDMYNARYAPGGKLIVYARPETQRLVVDFLMQLREIRAISVLIEARKISITSGWSNFFQSSYPMADLITEDYVGPFTALNATWAGAVQAPVGPATGMDSGASTAAVSGFQMNLTFIDGITLDALFSALEKSKQSQQVDMPRLHLANGQMGYLSLTETQDYISDVTSQVAESAVSYTVTTSNFTSGTEFTFRPTVSYDRRYVQLDIQPDVESILDISPYVFPTSEGDISTQLLKTSQVSLRATVSVPDGGTVFLGGQTTAGEAYSEAGIPILSKIPLLGTFFRSRVQIRDNSSTLFLATPHIIIRDDYEARQ